MGQLERGNARCQDVHACGWIRALAGTLLGQFWKPAAEQGEIDWAVPRLPGGESLLPIAVGCPE